LKPLYHLIFTFLFFVVDNNSVSELPIQQKEHQRKTVPVSPITVAPSAGAMVKKLDTLPLETQKRIRYPFLVKKRGTVIDQIVQKPSSTQLKPWRPYHNDYLGKKSNAKVLLITACIPLLTAVGIIIFSGLTTVSLDVEQPDILINPGKDSGLTTLLSSYAGLSGSDSLDLISRLGTLEEESVFAWLKYSVKTGDSVSSIAQAHNVSIDAIIASNGISNARKLQIGDNIRIPNIDGIPYTIKAGDTLSAIAEALHVPMEVIIDVNSIQIPALKAGEILFIPGARMPAEDLKLALGENFIYPISGRLTSTFGWRVDPLKPTRRNYHKAIDLAAPTGTPVKATMDGRIVIVDSNPSFGKFVIISHNATYQTLYAHLSTISVRVGTTVSQGQKIGEVGNTGYSTGSHLHFAIYKKGNEVDPLDYLNK
jgi:murein DD-endopeptidase MepM/ murein hydrolase activator NlpD